MDEIAGWIAPAATMLAAMMTAANMGTRITGWGFVIFTIGSLGWIAVAVASGQSNLLWSNAFLTVVNVAGIWRWLGRQARVEDAAAADGAERLFPATGLAEMAVRDAAGAIVAKTVEAMADVRSGRIDHLIVSMGGMGGVGATLHRLRWDDVRMSDDGMTTRLDRAAMARLPKARA